MHASSTCRACGAPRASSTDPCPVCNHPVSTCSLPDHRVLEVVAEAIEIAGRDGVIVVEAASAPGFAVQAGHGLRLAGRIASPHFLAPAGRFRAGHDGPGSPADLDGERAAPMGHAAQVLRNVQLAEAAGGAAARRAIIPLVGRSALRGQDLCIVGFDLDQALVQELLRRHHSGELRCPAFCLADTEQPALRRLAFKPNTGFFGEDAAAVTIFFELVEVRADELLVFCHSSWGAALPPAARIVVGRSAPARTQQTVAEIRAILGRKA